ncbi:integrase, catalytic region, zinc finger, CCHC-type containing protein, partial [Tanacetum coccineum]
MCPLTRVTTTAEVSLRKPTPLESDTPKHVVTLVCSKKPRKSKTNVPVVQLVLWYLDYGCSKHMTEDRSQLTNFVNKFLGIVKFRNDHVAKILGYGDYQIGNVTILRVYYVEGLRHNLFSIGQLCDLNLEVAFRQHTSFIRNLEGVDLLTGSRGNNLYTLSRRDMMACSPICLLSKASKTKSVATACYTHNRSIIRLHYGKTPYELLHDKLPDLSFFHVFGALWYLTNDSENLAMASKHSSSGPALHEMTPAIISSGLVPNPPPLTPFVPPSRTDWDLLFQLLFDELLNPPSSVDRPTPEVIALIAELVSPEHDASTGSPSSTTVDQDAPSPNNSQTTPKTQSPVIPNDVDEDNHDLDVAQMNNDPFFGILILENNFEASSSSDVIPTIVHTAAPNSEHITKWTKDHPLDNIIGELERPVSTRLLLHEQALFCYYNAFLTSVEPKNDKDALTQACWIKAMQEELNEFERLEVWELVPRPDKEFYKGTVDPTLFIRRQGKDILLISQSPRGIFINQSKYALKSLKKYGTESSDPVDNPMVEISKLDKDTQGKAVDPHTIMEWWAPLCISQP